MADGVEVFNEQANVNKVKAGFKGGQNFKTPNLAPAMSIVDGVPAEVKAKLQETTTPTMPTRDSWKQR